MRGTSDTSKRKDRSKGKASVNKQGERGGTLADRRGAKVSDRNENVFARPNGLRESAETVPVVGRRRKNTHRCVMC